MGRTARRAPSGLSSRLAALAEVVLIADGRLSESTVTPARMLVERAGARLALGPHLTVVALAGGTGSGKSSLFNALAEVDLATTGVRRPTTSAAQACVWGSDPADELLEWVGATQRHRLGDGSAGELDGLVLLDLPDHDSTAVAHQLEVNRLVELVDVLVWVLDPQKYADAAVHDTYLRPLAGHSAVLVVVLNQIDLLDVAARESCLADVGRLVAQDGLRDVPVIATSTRTGAGVADLRQLLAVRVAAKHAAVLRLEADVDRTAIAFAAAGDQGAIPKSDSTPARSVSKQGKQDLVRALASAAGADVVVDAVVRDHRRQAAGMTGWPFTTWLRKLRPDPLRRLHLSPSQPVESSRSSLPAASPVQLARVTNATNAASDSVTSQLPQPWPRLVRRAAGSREADLPDVLDRAVAGTQLTSGRRPAWWSVVRLLQRALGAAALIGVLWLALLFVFSYFRLPEPPTPKVREIPWPTLLLLGGVLLGWLVAVISRYVARAAAARRGRRARRALDERIAAIADEAILAPMMAEVEVYQAFRAALSRTVRS
ncbi:MAG: YfjP family GTPase [Mycobacteriales bacterium]